MVKMNFPLLCKWVLECVTIATASVLVNESSTNEFKMETGLHQEDPLSPFLFRLAAEGLNLMMNALVENGLLTAFGVGAQTNVFVSHLEFTDDTLSVGGQKLG